MKSNIIKTLMVVMTALFAFVFETKANPVGVSVARNVGAKFLNANAKVPLRGAQDLQLVTTYNTERGDAAFHIFNTPNGFVIVSADDCATPILGYSDEGRPFDPDNVPIQLQDYLQGFVEQIQYGIENHLVADEKTAEQWRLVLSTGKLSDNRDGTQVGPLLTTTWGQACYYNALCPEDPEGSCGHVVTGCVATAMAQIMRYWDYPKCGVGSYGYTPDGYPEQYVDFGATIYDWDNMPSSLNSSSTTEQVNAVATLMWHCGVSVGMGYSASESGASSEDVSCALFAYFNYDNDMVDGYRESNPHFLQEVKDCLDQSRPLYYSADNGQLSHAFVCDGYDSDDMLHFNWGWGGTSDGFFAIDALAGGYNNNHFAIFNIHPKVAQGASYLVNVSASPSSGGLVSGTGQYDWGDVCTVTATPSQGYYFLNWTEDGQIVYTRPQYSFFVMSDRNLVANFSTIDPFSDYIQFADSQVKALCVANWDSNGDGELSKGEAAKVTSLRSVFRNTQITSFDELRYFTGLRIIGPKAFESCSSLISITIPQSVVAFYNCIFNNCTDLTNVSYMGNLEHWFGIRFGTNGISNPLFYASNFYINDELVTDLVIPETVTELRSKEFLGLTCLTSVTIPSSVTSIGEDAFYGCTGLTQAIFADGLQSIGDYAFYGCAGLPSVTIPNSVTSIGEGAFYGCTGLTSVYYTGDIAQWCGIEFNSLFSNPVFYSHSLFVDDQLVTDLVVPNSVSTIGDYSFINCTSLTSLDLSNSVTSIGIDAFSGCTGLVSVTLSSSLVSISESAFARCSGLASITIPNSLTSIGSGAFSYSGIAGTLIIPNSVTSIGQYAFCDCLSLTSVAIPNGVTIIEEGLFSECSNLASVVIPPSVSFIGKMAFCSSGITSLFVEAETPPALGEYVFAPFTPFYSSSISLFVPCGLVETYQSDENWQCFSRIYDMCSPATITTSVMVEGGGTVTGAGTYDLGTICTLTATASDGYLFYYWMENGTVVSHDANYSFVVSGNRNLVAFFDGPHFINVVANLSEGGVVTGTGTYMVDSLCTVTATANENYTFLYWTENGIVVSLETSYSFIVTCDRNLVAYFVENNSSCEILIDLYDGFGYEGWEGNYLVVDYGNGAIERFTIESGPNASFSRMIATGSDITLSWIEGLWVYRCSFDISYGNGIQIYHGSDLNSNFQYQFMVDCEAAYSQHLISTVADPQEGGTVTGSGEYAYYSTCTLTAIPNAGYAFLCWAENDEVVSTAAEYTFIVTGGRTLTAFFEEIITFADFRVKALCVANWDTNLDGELSYTEAGAVHNLGSVFSNNTQITSFDELQYFDGLTTIGAQAFMGCSKLASVTIPASVTSIGSYAFANCTRLNTIVAMPETPPSLGADVFQSVSNDAALHVPCSSLEAYQLASGWKAFDNYYALDCTSWKITATVTPAEGGSVMGFLGVYEEGATCSLTAVANDGYEFKYWTENDDQVSSEAEISFVVYANRNLVAHFKVLGLGEGNIEFADENVKSICVLNWDTNNDGELSYEEASMVTSLEQVFGGNNEIFAFDELQYFINLNVISWMAFYNCTNLCAITIPNSVTSIQHMAFAFCYSLSSMTVLAETPPELQDGSVFFQTWTEFPLYVPCGCSGAYQAADGWNVFTDIQENCTQPQTVTQTIALESGYNMVSTYVDVTLDDLKAALVSAFGETTTGIQIFVQDGTTSTYTYRNGGYMWRGTITSWDATQSLIVYAPAVPANAFVLEGEPLGNTGISIQRGYNWISFTSDTETAFGTAFGGFGAVNGDQVISPDGTNATYNGTAWRGQLSRLNLVPGTGYIYFSASSTSRTLTFPSGGGGK